MAHDATAHDPGENLDRTRLPLPDTPTGGHSGKTVAESKMATITPIRPRRGRRTW